MTRVRDDTSDKVPCNFLRNVNLQQREILAGLHYDFSQYVLYVSLIIMYEMYLEF